MSKIRNNLLLFFILLALPGLASAQVVKRKDVWKESPGKTWLNTGSNNVGVGTSDPAQKLDVIGTVKAESFVGDGSQLTGITSAWAKSGGSVYPVSLTDNVGIGTDAPRGKLDVDGVVYGDEFHGSGAHLTDLPTEISGLSAGYLPKAASATQIINSSFYDNAGKLGIGTNTPQTAIDIRGLGAATVNVNYIPDNNGMCDNSTYRLQQYEGTSPTEQMACGTAQYGDSLSYSGVTLTTEQTKFGLKSMKINNGYIQYPSCPDAGAKRHNVPGQGTVSFWLYIPVGSGNQTIYLLTGSTECYWDYSYLNFILYYSATGNSSLYLYRDFIGGVQVNYTIQDGFISQGEWHHIMFVATGGFTYYRDGNRIGSGAAPSFGSGWGGGGARGFTAPQWFKTSGIIYIDDFLWTSQLLATGPTYTVPTKPWGANVSFPKLTLQGNSIDMGAVWVDGNDAGKLKFNSGTTPKMTIDTAGNVGIGTNVPRSLLEVGVGKLNVLSGGNVGINTVAPTRALDVVGTGNISGAVGLGATTVTGNLTATGNIGIGTTAPVAKIDTVGVGTTNSTSNLILRNSAKTPLVTVLDNGNMGIGTSNPGKKLEVGGTFQASDYYAGDGSQGITDATSFWMCKAADCSVTCQANIKDGLVTSCP